MAPIAFAPRLNQPVGAQHDRELLGGRRGRSGEKPRSTATSFTKGKESHAPARHVVGSPVDSVPVAPVRTGPTEFEKVVRRIPTLYVIAFFGVVVVCAVLIIWNTLQVNRLTLERTKLDDAIEQTEQRLIKARAEEMQLSAPSRIRDLAQQKLGMVEANGEELVVVH